MSLYTPSEREKEVLAAYIRHGSVKRAAEVLFLSESTINNHLDHLRSQFDLKTRPQLIAMAVEERWVPQHSWEE